MYRGLPVAGSRVIVTGGGSGLGRQLALQAARRGASHVTLWDLRKDAAQRVADEVRAVGVPVIVQQVNVADRDAVQAAADDAGAADIIINSAGVVSGKPLLEITDEEILRTFDVNVLALYWVTRAFLPSLVAQDRGVIVNLASAAGLVGVARQTDYSASKWAAVGFTESLRNELRTEGSDVGTLVVCPYYINTGMFEGVRTKFPRLLPILEEQDVASKILDAIEAGREQLILPWFPRLLPVTRLLPVRAFDALVDFFGINRTMDRFTGRR